MAKDPNEFVKLSRTGKESGGGWFYLNAVCLEKALGNVNIPSKGVALKVKQYAMKGKKNVAQIVLEIRIDKDAEEDKKGFAIMELNETNE